MAALTGGAKFGLDWRLAWYSSLVWLLLTIASNLIVFPWFYLALPAVVFLVSALYLGRRGNPSLLAESMKLGVVWFIAVVFLDVVAFVGFDLGNLYIYLADSRNFFKLPMVILVPFFYGLLTEQKDADLFTVSSPN